MKKIIHTADWHLGAKLLMQDRLEEQRSFLRFLRGLLIAEHPDLLVVTGDIFDTGAPTTAAQALYGEFFAQVYRDGATGNVLILGGNHDSPSVLKMNRELLGCLNTIVVPEAAMNALGEPDPEAHARLIRCADGGMLAIAALPFLRSSDLRNTAPAGTPPEQRLAAGAQAFYARAVAAARALEPKAPLLLTGHCTVQGSTLSDDKSERIRDIGGIKEIGLDILPQADYVALGHLHIAQAVGGHENIRYAGSPIAMSFSEAGSEKSVSIVTIDEARKVSVELRKIPDTQEFLRLSGAPEEILANLEHYLEEQPNSSAWLEVRVTEGMGDLLPFHAKLKQLVKPTSVVLCSATNERRTNLSASAEAQRAALADTDLLATSPHELAKKRLETQNLTLEEIEAYLELFDEIVNAPSDAH